jgi:hypothetical protein
MPNSPKFVLLEFPRQRVALDPDGSANARALRHGRRLASVGTGLARGAPKAAAEKTMAPGAEGPVDRRSPLWRMIVTTDYWSPPRSKLEGTCQRAFAVFLAFLLAAVLGAVGF